MHFFCFLYFSLSCNLQHPSKEKSNDKCLIVKKNPKDRTEGFNLFNSSRHKSQEIFLFVRFLANFRCRVVKSNKTSFVMLSRSVCVHAAAQIR